MQRIQFDTAQMAFDIAAQGWDYKTLAKKSRVAQSTVTRFLSGQSQTAPTCKRLATALGYSVRRYLRAA